MSDFKDFVDNVLAPIRAGDSSPSAQITRGAGGESQASAPNVPLVELDRRYVAVMDALLVDAQARGAVRVFTDAVTWKLAVVASRAAKRSSAMPRRLLCRDTAGNRLPGIDRRNLTDSK